MHMFSYEAEAHCLHEDRKDPGYRIGNKQETQRPVCREKSKDPHNPGSYGTDNRKNHRYSGISHSPEGSREQIHNTTTEIWYCSKGKDFHATADYICITGVDLQKFRSKEIRSTAKGQCHTDRKDHTVQKYSVHSFQFLYSIVLTGETHTGLGDCIDRHIEKAKNIIAYMIRKLKSLNILKYLKVNGLDLELIHRMLKIYKIFLINFMESSYHLLNII